jgi:quinoprotein glucose dehydrogenase
MRAILAAALSAPAILSAQTVDWPIYGGSPDNTHYTTLGQITPANVASLKVAWTYETKDEWKGSEMQTNPVVVDGILYGTSPKLRVFALDAATGKELWSFDPNPVGPRRSGSGIAGWWSPAIACSLRIATGSMRSIGRPVNR